MKQTLTAKLKILPDPSDAQLLIDTMHTVSGYSGKQDHKEDPRQVVCGDESESCEEIALIEGKKK